MPRIDLARMIPVGFNATGIPAFAGVPITVLAYATDASLARIALRTDLAAVSCALILTGLGIALRQLRPA